MTHPHVTLIVDGYNAINKIRSVRLNIRKGLELARKDILAKAKTYAHSSGHITDVKVVFDGDNRYRENQDIFGDRHQIFSETGKGDERIIELISESSHHGRVIVASNDNYVRNNARAYGATIISVEKLVEQKNKKVLHNKSSSKRIEKSLQEEITHEYRKELDLSP